MTFLQLKIVVMAVELGSITLAAKKNGISQSNASAYIKDLEKELGSQLLDRSHRKIRLTEEGQSFFLHAKNILDEQESILLRNSNQLRHLRVGSMFCGAASKAFNEICIRHSDENNMDYRYINVSLEGGIDMLKKHEIDILVAFIRSDLIENTELILKVNRCQKMRLGTMKATIRIRKDHPALKEAVNEKGFINPKALIDNPYIDYWTFLTNADTYPYYNNFETSSKRIFVNDPQSRNQIVANTNAYSMGVGMSSIEAEKQGILCIPIENLHADCCVITRKNDLHYSEYKEYISLLKEKIDCYLNQ